MVTVLPRKDGFAQRHSESTWMSSYLQVFGFPFDLDLARSPVTLKSIRDDIFKFRSISKVQPKCPYLELAIAKAFRQFKIPLVEMIHLNDVFKQDLNIWTSSPGLPWKDIGYKTKGDIRKDPDAINKIRWFWHRIKHDQYLHAPDSCAFMRSHLAKKGETKVRAVWGYPATITFGEAVFAVPLIKAYQKYGTSPIAYGYETAIGGTKKLFDQAVNYPNHVALDFKSFDKTVPSWLIRIAFDVLRYNIDFSKYQEYGVADVHRMWKMWDYIIDYFINTPIRLCNGERYRKHSGVASGSYFTQLIDSVVNYILIEWMALRQSLKILYCRVLGDDSIMSLNKPFDIDSAAELAESIGMIINVAKSASSRHIHNLSFLGFRINNGRPTKDTFDWLAALAFPEYKDRSWDDLASRALGLLYACSGTDKFFDRLCRDIISFKPFELNFGRSVSRFLSMLGFKPQSLTTDLPSPMQFARRLGVY
nr:RNA dependent RNA polymerase [Baringo Partiti-like virus]